MTTAQALERAREAAKVAASLRARQRLEDAIAETLTPDCRCGLHAGMTHAELRALNAGCTAPKFVCPTLDAVRRRIDA